MNYFNNVYYGRRVLITGNTGFKGSWLSLWLKELGAEVAGFSHDVPSIPSNFELLGMDKYIKHYQGDIRDKESLSNAIDDFRPEIIFHLAAQALVQSSYIDPVTTIETNTIGMLNLLECIRVRSWIDVAVLITSDKAYRNDEWCWGYRETDILGGKDPYSSSKGCAELIAYSYYHSFLKNSTTRIATTRAGNVIGGGDWAADRIVPDCIRAWSHQQPVTVRSPKSTRPWQHVLEPLSGYLQLGSSLWMGNSSLDGEAFNFGPDSDVNQTVEELLSEMSLYWSDASWEVPEGCELGGHEAKLLKLSCDKVLYYLNWKATLNFTETVSFTVDWYNKWYHGINIYKYSVSQINEYCQIAERRGRSWTKAR